MKEGKEGDLRWYRFITYSCYALFTPVRTRVTAEYRMNYSSNKGLHLLAQFTCMCIYLNMFFCIFLCKHMNDGKMFPPELADIAGSFACSQTALEFNSKTALNQSKQ